MRVNAGYKATLKSEYALGVRVRRTTCGAHAVVFADPNVSEEAKEHAHDVLEERDAL